MTVTDCKVTYNVKTVKDMSFDKDTACLVLLQLLQIKRTGESTWESKCISRVMFKALVEPDDAAAVVTLGK